MYINIYVKKLAMISETINRLYKYYIFHLILYLYVFDYNIGIEWA